ACSKRIGAAHGPGDERALKPLRGGQPGNMPRMIDLVRNSEVPSNLMHAAARGALAVLPAENLEILVHLANHNKVFGDQARLTLAGCEKQASLTAASDPATAHEVLEYFVSLRNLRQPL